MKKLRFYLNKDFDKFMADQFLDEKGGGIDFGENIFKIHPQLKSAKFNLSQRKKIISDYFDRYYQKYENKIKQKIERLKRSWVKLENEFVTTSEDFFGGFRFPEGKYIAYASIINCNPRFLDSKTFQFFYKKSIADAMHTIAHELLHFIFFDFVDKKLKNEIKLLSSDQLWNLSEIFNVVVLRSPRYLHIINQKFAISYPDHRRFVRLFEKAYKKSSSAEEFIKYGIAIIKTKK